MASKTSSAAAVPEFSQLPAPLLVDIKTAAQMLGTSVFNVRNLCWHAQHRAMLAPVASWRKISLQSRQVDRLRRGTRRRSCPISSDTDESETETEETASLA